MLKLVSCALSDSALWRLGARRFASAAGAVAAHADKTESAAGPRSSAGPSVAASDSKQSGLVAAAFASLNSPENEDTETPKPSPKSAKVNKYQQIDNTISQATDLNTLLGVAENPVISRRHALKIVSQLSEWSSNKKVKLQDFETDARFLRLCRVLARSREAAAVSSLSHPDDLSTVLTVTGEDEAARLVAALTLHQMIKVMTVLRARGKRSISLLRSLAHHMTRSAETLSVQQACDLLYCIASLNFPDPPLMEKICSDLVSGLDASQRSIIVNSALVSLGLLRYRCPVTLDALCSWLVRNPSLRRPTDLQAALMTLGTVAYHAQTAPELVQAALQLRPEDMSKPSAWLDLVWSLLLLGAAPAPLVHTVLQPAFIDRLHQAGEIPVAHRRKLGLMHAHATLTAGSASDAVPAFPEEAAPGFAPVYSRDKLAYVACVRDTLHSLLTSDKFLKTDCNSGMGFLYDAEFAVDAKCHPVPLDKAATTKGVTRVAVMSLDYHDFTRRTLEPLGVNQLYARLLQLKGYKVLLVPYTEFSPRDKSVARVQYIERTLKALVAPSSS